MTRMDFKIIMLNALSQENNAGFNMYKIPEVENANESRESL